MSITIYVNIERQIEKNKSLRSYYMNHVLRYLFLSIIISILGCEKEESIVYISRETDNKIIVYGKIYCETYPAGAKIYIDSLFTGKVTPALIDSVTEDIHAVEFKKMYFSDYITAAQVRSNVIPAIRCTLKQTLNISNYFPLTVGSSWKYERIDTGLSNYTDTTGFSVADMGVANNGTVGALWIEKYGTVIDSNIVYENNDTLRFNLSGYESKTFPFPLSIGKTWSVGSLRYNVDTIETVTTKVGVFQNCAKVQKNTIVPNTYGHPTYWIHPDVGIVKVYDYDFVERRYQVWNLKSYFIAQK